MRIPGILRRRATAAPPGPADVVVRAAGGQLTAETVSKLSRDVEAAGVDRRIVIDLSDVSQWDSVGAGAVADLAARLPEQIEVAGLAEATERLLATEEPLPPSEHGVRVTMLHNVAVLSPQSADHLSGTALEDAIGELPDEITTVVVDLAAVESVGVNEVQELAFASSRCEVSGRGMLLVNCEESVSDALRPVGLSAATWIAPPPLA